MHLSRVISVLVFSLLAICVAGAQTDTLHLTYTVRGTVSDARSGKAIPSVNITVPDRHYATVSNADGAFVIKSDSPISELVFSCVGYKTLRARVTDGMLAVRMTPDKYLLDPSSIISGEPSEIVRSAIRMIPENYSTRPELLRCFYREALLKRNRYIAVSEAVSRIYKSSYLQIGRDDRAALDKSRIIVSQRRRDTISVKMMGGPTLAATFDVVKNPVILFEDFETDLYGFEMGAPEYIDDRLQFVIRFKPVREAPYALYNGTLYIDRDRLSFTRVEMSMDMSDPAKVTRQLLVKKPAGLRFTPKEMTFVVTYRQNKGTLRLAYTSATMRFNCDWKKRMVATNYTVINENVVTDVLEPAVQIPRSQQFRATDYMTDRAGEFLDPDFWEDYNIIEPSESLEHAVGRLHKTY